MDGKKAFVAKNRLEIEMSEGRVKIHLTETQKAMMAPRMKNFPTKGDLHNRSHHKEKEN